MRHFFLLICLATTNFCYSQSSSLDLAQQAKTNGDYQKAYELFKQAADDFISNDAPISYVETHLEMINCLILMGDPFHAKSLSENTLEYIQTEMEASNTLIARTYTLMGFSLLNLGRSDEALENLLQAETLFGENETAEKATCFNILGLAYWNNGNKALALQYLEQALSSRRSLLGKGALEVGDSFNNLGLIYQQDEPLQALIYFNQARRIYEKKLGENDRKTALVITNMALANKFQKNFDEALKLLEQVKSIYASTYSGDHPTKAFIESSIGRVFLGKGEMEQAIVQQNNALQMYIRMFGEKHPDVANTYYLIGQIHQANASFPEAVTFFQQSIYSNFDSQSPGSMYDLPVLENYFNADILLSSLQAKAIALEALHYEKTLNTRDLKASIETYKLCDELISLIRRQRLSEQDKLKLGAVAKEVYESGIRLSLTLSEQSFRKKEYLATAFEFCERSKSSVLLEAITETKAKNFSGIPKELLQLEDSLKDEISYLERKLAEPKNAEDQQLKNLIFTYQNAYRSFISNLEKEYPKYYNLKYSHNLASIQEVQSKLNENAAMLSYFVGNDQIFVFLITPRTAKAFDFHKDPSFEKNTAGMRNAIKYNVTSAFRRYAKSLYEQLIPKMPTTIQELIILPDGALGSIPFEALLSPQDKSSSFTDAAFLIREYHTSYDYSATLFLQKTYKEVGSNPQILLVAPVDFKENEVKMSTLPGSEEEITEIKYLFLGNSCEATLQVKGKASETNLKAEDLSKYQYLHFATHGFVNESKPALSKIFLQPDQNEDGSLYAGEIYNLKIDADLVTLSACETGLGKVAKGEGIVGLSRALQYAGANNIIVSLWQVADASTSKMMIEFYKYNLNNIHHGYNTALRQAKLSLLDSEEYNRPYYWAPFILVGI